jgi:hypothetical protein
MKFRVLFQLVLEFSILILLAPPATAQVAPPAPTEDGAAPVGVKISNSMRGSITGRVLGDDGQPLAGVSISVSSMSVRRRVRRAVSTDDEGNFKVNDLPAGAYNVAATSPGLVNLQSGTPDATPFNSMGIYRLGANVTITMIKGGVITGKVIDAAGRPLVGSPVRAIRVRDGEGRPVNETPDVSRPGMSDDRGVYRLYGLQPSSYIVFAGGAGEILSSSIGLREVPTYYPSATRDTAQEVAVSAGLEIRDIDIRHRGESGYAVSGRVVGASGAGVTPAPNVVIELFQSGTGTLVAGANVDTRLGDSFGVYGVPDGEYEIIARQGAGDFDGRREAGVSASAPRRVTVRGGDVSGLELRLVALSSITGRVALEKLDKADCQITRRGQLEELLLIPQREDKEFRHGAFAHLSQAATPDDRGEFVVRDLEAGRYRLNPQLPSDHWYVKAMSLGAAAPTGKPAARTDAPSLAASGIMLKVGEKLMGLTVTIAEGAARVSGRVEGKKLPARLRIHLAPAEAEAASDALRYVEVVTRDGSFSLSHLAPGKYWLLARAVPDDESDEQPAKPAAWDADARAKLRREARAANQVIELTPCQRAKDFVLKF